MYFEQAFHSDHIFTSKAAQSGPQCLPKCPKVLPISKLNLTSLWMPFGAIRVGWSTKVAKGHPKVLRSINMYKFTT